MMRRDGPVGITGINCGVPRISAYEVQRDNRRSRTRVPCGRGRKQTVVRCLPLFCVRCASVDAEALSSTWRAWAQPPLWGHEGRCCQDRTNMRDRGGGDAVHLHTYIHLWSCARSEVAQVSSTCAGRVSRGCLDRKIGGAAYLDHGVSFALAHLFLRDPICGLGAICMC